MVSHRSMARKRMFMSEQFPSQLFLRLSVVYINRISFVQPSSGSPHESFLKAFV